MIFIITHKTGQSPLVAWSRKGISLQGSSRVQRPTRMRSIMPFGNRNDFYNNFSVPFVLGF